MSGKVPTSAHGENAIYNINVTPLVDVTLVLLIIMMVTAKMIVSHALPMDQTLRGDSSATPAPQIQSLAVELKADGRTLVDHQPISDDRGLIGGCRRARERDPAVRVVIEADARTRHGRVIHVLDVLNQAGVSRVAFEKPPKGG